MAPLILSPVKCEIRAVIRLLQAQNESSEIVKGRFCLAQSFHEFWRHQGLSYITIFGVHISSAFSEFPAPLSDHTDAHNVGFIHVTQLAVDWKLLLSVQKSDNGTILAVGGKWYQYRHFFS